MKNLFKNLMLVAVAAMAFTACQNDNNEVNEVNRVTRYEFTANIADDTRSGFAEKEEGATAYKSEWFGDETLKLFITDYNGYYVETTTPINAKGQFTLELENAPESFFMTVCSPAESWASEYTANIPTEQTPLANSVDPKAHVLSAPALPISGNSASITMSPQSACYGKMTVNAPDFTIAKVEVSFNGGKVYTINAKNVEDNVFWFAVDSEINVSTFTVTAYDAEGNAVAKTVDVAAAGKTLKFQWGRVSTFSVSGLKETYDYTTAYVSNTWGSTDKLITFTAEGKDDLNVNFVGRSFDGNALAAGTYYYDDGVYNYGISLGSYYGSGGLVTAYSVGSVSVSIENGNYVIIFTDLRDQYSNSMADRLIFKGTIEGLDVPDSRTKLATPSNVKLSVSGKDITVTWDEVDNAVEYSVECYLGETKVVTDTTVTFSLPNYEEDYGFRITALAGESDKYRDSETTDWYEIKTGADPREQLSTPNVTTSISGKTITLTWEKVENAESYLINGDSLEEPISTTELTTTITVPDYNNHSFTVQAVVSDDNESYRSSEEANVEYSDPRAVLPVPTNIKATIDGRYATIEWDAVEGADYYQLSYYLNGNQTVDVAETSHTIDVGFEVSNLWVYVFAKANEDNPGYKSSESQDGSVVVNTGKDPDALIADNVATDLYFNGDELIFVVDAYETFKVKLNSADRPGNTTIKEGEYVGINSSTVGVGKFSVYQKIKGGYSEGYTSTKTTSTMSVEYVDGQYLIIVNYVGQYGGSGEVGYKGVPNGWDAPVADTAPVIKVDQSSVELKRAGSSVDVNVTLKNITDAIVAESNNAQFTTSVNGNVVTISADENNTGADINGVVTISAGGVSTTVSVKQVAENIVLEVYWSYSFNSSSSGVYGHVWNVSGKDLDGYDISAQIAMDSRNGYTSSSNFTPGTYSYHAQYADGNFGSGMWFTMRNIELRGTSYSNYDVTGTITVEVEGGRTKVTADIYNLVNGYTTTKITTFVGYLN